jgi:hypothetical protein
MDRTQAAPVAADLASKPDNFRAIVLRAIVIENDMAAGSGPTPGHREQRRAEAIRCLWV